MHHKAFILCGIVNGSSSGPCCVVEGRGALELVLQANKGLPMHTTVHTLYQHEENQAVLRTTLLSLTCLPAMWPTWSKFNASNWLISILWVCLVGGGGLAIGQVVKGECVVCACV